VAAFYTRAPLVTALERASAGSVSLFGPFDARGAVVHLQRALAQGAVVLLAGLALACWGPRAPAGAGAAAVALMAADLALANARYVLTVSQALFETRPEVLEAIAEAERLDPAPSLYRIHRMPLWDPAAWKFEPARDRVRDFVVWERNTIQPKYGLRY